MDVGTGRRSATNQINYLGYSYGTELGDAPTSSGSATTSGRWCSTAPIDPSIGSDRRVDHTSGGRVPDCVQRLRRGLRPQSTGLSALGHRPRISGSFAVPPVDRSAGGPSPGRTTDLRRAQPRAISRRDHGHHPTRSTPLAVLEIPHQRPARVCGAAPIPAILLLTLADEYFRNGTTPRGTTRISSQDAFNAIRCVDAPVADGSRRSWADADRQAHSPGRHRSRPTDNSPVMRRSDLLRAVAGPARRRPRIPRRHRWPRARSSSCPPLTTRPLRTKPASIWPARLGRRPRSPSRAPNTP